MLFSFDIIYCASSFPKLQCLDKNTHVDITWYSFDLCIKCINLEQAEQHSMHLSDFVALLPKFKNVWYLLTIPALKGFEFRQGRLTMKRPSNASISLFFRREPAVSRIWLFLQESKTVEQRNLFLVQDSQVQSGPRLQRSSMVLCKHHELFYHLYDYIHNLASSCRPAGLALDWRNHANLGWGQPLKRKGKPLI